MATKEQNQKRLRSTGPGLLGREADMSGSAADIAQRVSEWEEELAVIRRGCSCLVMTSGPGAEIATDDGEQLHNTDATDDVKARPCAEMPACDGALPVKQGHPVELTYRGMRDSGAITTGDST
ncbi:DNA-packaging protein FI [Escherichia coli]